MANRINWIEIPTEDLDRAAEFYGSVLGCAVDMFKEDGYAVLAYEAGEVSGALVQCELHRPSRNGVLVYLNVEGRLAEAVETARQHGVTVLEDIHPVGPYGSRAIVLDTEGNRVALHSVTGE